MAKHTEDLLNISKGSPLHSKIINERCFIREWGRGEGDFSLVWLSIELIFYTEILLFITEDIQSKRPFGAIVAPQPL
jgi:hypothetical protein